MAMIGNQPAAGVGSISIANDSFNGTGSATSFTLSQTVSATTDIEVIVDNVQQSPYDSSYSVSGTTLTFSAAPSAGTNNIYVIYNHARTITTNQVIPDDGSVHSSKIANNSITTAHLHTGLSVPDSNIAAMATSKLTGDLPYANMPPGSVIQFGSAMYETQETYSINGGSFGGYSGLTGSITPRFSDSKIYGIICLDGVTWTSDGSYGHFRVYRQTSGGDTEIQHFGYPRQWSSVDNSSGVNMICHFYDAPVITTQVIYKFRFYSNSGTSNFNINRDSAGDSTITLMEIRL